MHNFLFSGFCSFSNFLTQFEILFALLPPYSHLTLAFISDLRCEVIIEVPLDHNQRERDGDEQDGEQEAIQRIRLTSSGDCAAAHAGWALGSPVSRAGMHVCICLENVLVFMHIYLYICMYTNIIGFVLLVHRG